VLCQQTCNTQRSVVTDDADSSLWVGGVAVVNAYVRLTVLVMNDSQEEQLAAGQQHAV